VRTVLNIIWFVLLALIALLPFGRVVVPVHDARAAGAAFF
jgi:uncharacterized membrane protein YccF (DUF307 family)